MNLWHVMNHGVETRDLFLDSSDYVRFIHNLYQLNDTAPASASARRGGIEPNVGPRRSYIRERLVDVHGWCLMKNHYHLLLSERADGGLSSFLMKMNVAYAKYFNERYSRNGALFRGKTKRVPITTDAQFNYILHYIHLNPLDYLKGAEEWRVRSRSGITSAAEALEYLAAYRWSSYLDYAGKKNFPSLLATSLFNNPTRNHAEEVREFLQTAQYDFDSLHLE